MTAKSPAQQLCEELVLMLIEEKSVHERLRFPLDRTVAVDRACSWLKERDPKGQHREYLARELRRMIGPDRIVEMDYYLEESLLRRLEAEDWFREQT